MGIAHPTLFRSPGHFLKELHRHDIDPKQVAAGKDPQGIGQYKKLWLVEQWFRACKSLVETRPIYHQRDETIRGHVFCSFLALLLRHELQTRLEARGHVLEWAEVLGDLERVQYVEVEHTGKRFRLRSELQGTAGRVFQAAGVAAPPTVQQVTEA